VVAKGGGREEDRGGGSPMAERAKITVGRFADGVAVQVDGAGTMSESPVVYAFAEETLKTTGQRVIVDLASCTYLDSTFLGGLVGLLKRHGGDGRFSIHAPSPRRQDLFGVSRLDKVLPFVDGLPAIEATFPLEARTQMSRDELGRYIVDCHRRLAELGGAEADDFGRVADALAGEIDGETDGERDRELDGRRRN
jgi:anti-sigma B factor antagonist